MQKVHERAADFLHPASQREWVGDENIKRKKNDEGLTKNAVPTAWKGLPDRCGQSPERAQKKSHRAIYLSIRLRWYFRTSMKVDSHGWITIYVKSEPCVITSVNCGMYPSVAEFWCEFECRLTLNVENRGWNVFYTRVWIKLGFRFPPGPPLSKDVAKIMFLTAIYVNFLWNLLTAIIVTFNLYWFSHCYGGGIQWEDKMIAMRINICILGF